MRRPTARIQHTAPPLHPLSVAVAACLRLGTAPVACALGLGASLIAASPLQAATFTVTNTDDSGPGSLRQAVLDANANPGADEVVFDSSVSGTISLASGGIRITESLDIRGPGKDALTIDGNASAMNAFVVEHPDTRVLATLSDVKVVGTIDAAINVKDSSTSWIRHTAAIADCTIEGNGAGVALAFGEHDRIENTVVANNSDYGVLKKDGILTISDTTVSGSDTGIWGISCERYYGPATVTKTYTKKARFSFCAGVLTGRCLEEASYLPGRLL